MIVATAAQQMLVLIERAKLPERHPDFGKDHLKKMALDICTGVVTGEKAHRWLGYIQGCVCMGGGATVEELKRLNYRSN